MCDICGRDMSNAPDQVAHAWCLQCYSAVMHQQANWIGDGKRLGPPRPANPDARLIWFEWDFSNVIYKLGMSSLEARRYRNNLSS